MGSALVLIALLVAAVLAGRYGRPAALLLAALSILWLFTNRSMEGRVLFTVSPSHGVVAADFVGLAGFVLAVLVWAFPRGH